MWPPRVTRQGLSKSKFAADTLFEVTIEVTESEYKIYLNGEQLSLTFPHREDVNTANHGTLLLLYIY